VAHFNALFHHLITWSEENQKNCRIINLWMKIKNLDLTNMKWAVTITLQFPKIKIHVLFYGDNSLTVALGKMKFGIVKYHGHNYKFYLNHYFL
jgi:hypothetical protein